MAQLADRRAVDRIGPALLPLLDTLLDPGAMQARLRRLAQTAGGRDLRVISARMLDYKAGQRAVIAYELERPSGERFRILGKHFHDPAQARRVHEIHVSLRQHVFRGAAGLGVPKPFGWLPNLSLVLYLPTEGAHLDHALLAGRTTEAFQHAADWLVQLHHSRLRLDRRLDLANELRNVTRWSEVVGVAWPEEASITGRIAERLHVRAAGIHLKLGSPIHKDFHYGHVVVGKRLTVLDFDEMRHGDPSFDLGHFCAYLYLLCVRRGWPPSTLRMLERAFLEEYAQRASWTRDDRFTYFSAYACLKIAWQLCLNVGVPPRPTGAERRRQVRAILGHGDTLAASLA